MAEREQKSSVESFSRGAELWMHQARMLAVSMWTAMVISLVFGAVVGGTFFYKKSSVVERYAMERNFFAELRLTLAMTRAPMEIYADGQKQMLPVSDVAKITEDGAAEAFRHLKNGGMIGCLSTLGFGLLLGLLWWQYGKGKMADTRLRGAYLVEGKELKEMMEERQDTSPYSIAGVPMRKGSETLHTLFGGAQGTGKSQQFARLMRQVRARGKRAIVYDPTGEFTKEFYREGIDVLMNPLDARSPNWNIWNEIERDYHFDNMANGLIPDPAEADPFWAQAGRMVLKDVYKVLGRDNRRTNADLYNSIAHSNLDAMHALLLGTAGATYVDPTTERTGMSLKMTIQNQLESFRFLHDNGDPFSIRKFVQNDSDSWMFITARESMRDALKPVLSLWIDTAIKAVLELEPIHRERLWFFIDELPTLQKLDVLKLALTNTRKYGLCCVIGIQDFSQLTEIYGKNMATTIISGCQTKLLLRVTDGDAARVLAKLMGEAELDEKEETLSYGLNSQRDGVSVMARRNLRDIVLTSQVLTLPDMTGYLTIPGDYPVARVEYKYEPNKTIAEGFVERPGFGINFAGGRPIMPSGQLGAEPNKERKGGQEKGSGGAKGSKNDGGDLFGPDGFEDGFVAPAVFNELDPDEQIEVIDRETGEVLNARPMKNLDETGATATPDSQYVHVDPDDVPADKPKKTPRKRKTASGATSRADDPDLKSAARSSGAKAVPKPATKPDVAHTVMHTEPPLGSLASVLVDSGAHSSGGGFIHVPPGMTLDQAHDSLFGGTSAAGVADQLVSYTAEQLEQIRSSSPDDETLMNVASIGQGSDIGSSTDGGAEVPPDFFYGLHDDADGEPADPKILFNEIDADDLDASGDGETATGGGELSRAKVGDSTAGDAASEGEVPPARRHQRKTER